jgi:EVE domain
MKYWINTISREHVQIGRQGGFTQADHGKKTRLSRLAKGDRIVFYSPRTAFRGGEALQRFTAVCEVADETPYQVEVSAGFRPWRRRVTFFACDEAPIAPLIGELSFIANKERWGFPFRRGLFEIGEADFETIVRAMGATSPPPAR